VISQHFELKPDNDDDDGGGGGGGGGRMPAICAREGNQPLAWRYLTGLFFFAADV